MCNKIINSLPFESYDKAHLIKSFGKKKKTKDLYVQGVIIKLKLTKQDVEKYYENWYLEIDDHVEQADA